MRGQLLTHGDPGGRLRPVMAGLLDAFQGRSPRIEAIRRQVTRLLARQEGCPPTAADPDPGRDRDGQGTPRPEHPRSRAASRRSVRGDQLRRHSRDPARGGAVRLRARRLHRRPQRQGRSRPGRARRHDVPRRDRAPAGGAPEQAAHRHRGPRRPPPGQHPAPSGSTWPCWRRRASISGARSWMVASARISITGSRSSRSSCRRCACGARTSSPSPTTSWPGPAPTTACRPAR